MRRKLLSAAVAAVALVILASPLPAAEPPEHQHHGGAAHATIQIPKSLQTEHEAIHAELVEAIAAPGRVGEAAKALAEVLHPHFVREEQIALPPLGLLEPLAAHAPLTEPVVAQALAMTDSLRAELPRMLDEHVAIRAAVEKLGAAARAEGSARFAKLAADLALHARGEEESFYPAALLVGEVLRARQHAH